MICDKFKESTQAQRLKYLVESNDKSFRDSTDGRDKFVLEMEQVEKKHNRNGLNGTRYDEMAGGSGDGEELDDSLTCQASWGTQFKYLYWRCFLEAKRNKRVLPTRFFQLLTAAVTIGIIYWQTSYDQSGTSNINSALFLLMIQISFNTAFTIATSFAREFPLLLKEYKDRAYGASPFYLAKVLIDLPFFFVSASVYHTISYVMIGLNPTFGAFIRCWGALLLIALIAVAYGHMASAIFPTPSWPSPFSPSSSECLLSSVDSS